MHKKILYIGVSSSHSHGSMAYGFLRAYAEMKGLDWEWHLLEISVKENPYRALDEIIQICPDLVVSTLYLFNRVFFVELIKKVAVLHPCQVVLGGPEFWGDNELFLRDVPEVTAVFRGDESGLSGFAELRHQPDQWSLIKGICYLDPQDRYIDNGTSMMEEELDDLPIPYFPEMFRRHKPFFQLETSRGCKNTCRFCTSPLVGRTRYLSLERVERALDCLKERHGVREVRVIDRTFNDDQKRCRAMLLCFAERYTDMRFHLEVNPGLLDQDTISSLSHAPDGQLHLEVGIQTFNAECLELIGRKASVSRCRSGLVQLCNLRNLDVHADLIFGLPGQSIDDVFSDVDQLLKMGPSEIQLEALKLLPGTSLDGMTEAGIAGNSVPPYEVLRTGTMSYHDLYRCHILSALIDKYYNSPALRAVFRFAALTVPGFLVDAVKQFELLTDPLGPLSQKNRFVLLEKVLVSYENRAALELLTFAWFASGASPARYGVKLYKHPSPVVPGGNEAERMLWQGSSEDNAKRYCLCEFNTNVGSLWLDPLSQQRTGQFQYRFDVARSNAVTSIVDMSPSS